jgi:hypothetical protein
MECYERAGDLEWLFCEGEVQKLPSSVMEDWVGGVDHVDIVFAALPAAIEAAASDVGTGGVDVYMGARRVEEQKIWSGAEGVAVELEIAPDPNVTVAFARMVEGGQHWDAREKEPGGVGERVEEGVVDDRLDHKVRKKQVGD